MRMEQLSTEEQALYDRSNDLSGKEQWLHAQITADVESGRLTRGERAEDRGYAAILNNRFGQHDSRFRPMNGFRER